MIFTLASPAKTLPFTKKYENNVQFWQKYCLSLTETTYDVFKIKNDVYDVNFKDVNANNVITSPTKPV